MVQKNFWEIVKVRKNRPNRNFGSYYGETEENALIRFFHLKGVEAMIGIHGQLVYSNPHNREVWGSRDDWIVRPLEKKPSRRPVRDIDLVRDRAKDAWL